MIASTTRKLATPTNTIVVIDSTRAWVLKAAVQYRIVRSPELWPIRYEGAVLKQECGQIGFCRSEMVV
jgi:hypothetical protein